LRIGTPAAVMTFGSYAEFMIVCILLISSISLSPWGSHCDRLLVLWSGKMLFVSCFAFQVPSKYILPVARPDPEVVAMLTSGLTASIALEKVYCSKS